MNPVLTSMLLLMCSNVFMTFAWYGHLKDMSSKPWIVAAIVSWGIALFEYMLQVPANRIGHTALSVGQLKIMQEVIALAVFVPFSVLYLKEGLKWRFSLYVLVNIFIPPDNHDFASSRRCSFILNQAK